MLFPAVLSMCRSLFYKWNDRPVTPRRQRREQLIGEIDRIFGDSGRTYGSPRIGDELREAGWQVSDNTIAAIMAENGWAARKPPKRRSLTRQGKRAVARDLVRRQFTAVALAAVCRAFGVVQSMGRVGSALDNSSAEAFNSTLKVEFVHRHRFRTRTEAALKIVTWITGFYNPTRRHSLASGKSPIDYETAMAAQRAAAAAALSQDEAA